MDTAAEVAPNAALAKSALTVGALGVVFGDSGTSPLYTVVQTIFNPGDPHPLTAMQSSVYGVISLTFWSATLIVTLKFVLHPGPDHPDRHDSVLSAAVPGRTSRAVVATELNGLVAGLLPLEHRQKTDNARRWRGEPRPFCHQEMAASRGDL